MITQLLRRLQGRPAPDAPAGGSAMAAGSVSPTGASPSGFDAESLDRRFLEWAFGIAACDAASTGAASEAAFAHLDAVAGRFDVRRMPRLPALVPQLLAEMRRERADAQSLAAIVERDPTLVGDVMRVAGSAFYRREQPAAGLRQAVQTIGHEGLRHVVLSSVMRPILRGEANHPGFAIAARLWSHTEATTWLCGRLAAGQCDPAGAQLAGVVAGTGLAALTRMVPAPLLADAAMAPDFARRLHAIAGPLASRAGAHWHLPPDVLEALHPPRDDVPRCAVAGVLRAADRLAMVHCLMEAERLASGTDVATGWSTADEPGVRTTLLAEMARELAPRAREPEAVA